MNRFFLLSVCLVCGFGLSGCLGLDTNQNFDPMGNGDKNLLGGPTDTSGPSTTNTGDDNTNTNTTETTTPSTGDNGGSTPSAGDNGGSTPSTGDNGGSTPSTGDNGGSTPGSGDNGGDNGGNGSTCVQQKTVVTLKAGQHHNAGTVTVQRDGDILNVTVNTADGWTMSESHLNVTGTVGELGDHSPGQFPFHGYHNPAVSTYTFKIDLNKLGLNNASSLSIAFHAVVGTRTQQETAWGEGDRFGGGWAMNFQHKNTCIPSSGDGSNGGDSGSNGGDSTGGLGSTPTP